MRGQADVSTEYTCHCWAKDPVQLIVATANGDILVCAMTGEFMMYVPASPQGSRIDCVIPYSRGLIFSGEGGMIWPFESTSNESQVYRPQQEAICSADRELISKSEIPEESITQLVLNSTEDVLYYIDRNNQLLKVNIALDGTDVESTRSEYVHGPFHHEEITGMDTCLRK